jgi:hypothetical protein
VNTIYGVIHAAGGYTAWSDKYPAYSAVAVPGYGSNLERRNARNFPVWNSIELPDVLSPRSR